MFSHTQLTATQIGRLLTISGYQRLFRQALILERSQYKEVTLKSIALPNIVYCTMYVGLLLSRILLNYMLVNDHTLDVQCTCIQDVWHFF